MSLVMSLTWPEITPELYEAARQRIRWDTEPPDGLFFHVAWFLDDGFHALDVWDSPEQMQQFEEGIMMPFVTGELGVESAPHVEVSPAHAFSISGAATAA